jgi:L-lactate dehydrogenase complex protein LldE
MFSNQEQDMATAPSRVHLFIPCFVDQFLPESGLATVHLLRRQGLEVVYEREQTCCGQPAFNSGFHHDAAHLAKRFLGLFKDAEAVIAPSASCVAMVRRHYGELGLEGEDAERWESLRTRIWELSEFLVDVLGVKKISGAFPHRVAYHTSCHGYRELGILNQPLSLLRSLKKIDLVELDDQRRCCGFGGTFAVKFSGLSTAMGEDKIQAIENSGASIVTATDDSCLMHLAGMISRRKLPIKTLHYARILAGEMEGS